MSRLGMLALFWLSCGGGRHEPAIAQNRAATPNPLEYVVADPIHAPGILARFSLRSGEQQTVKLERCHRAWSEDQLFETMLKKRGHVVERASPEFPEGWGFFGMRFKDANVFGDLFSEQVSGARGHRDGAERCRTYLIRLQRPIAMAKPQAWAAPFSMPGDETECNPYATSFMERLGIPFVMSQDFLFPPGTYCERKLGIIGTVSESK